MLEDNFRVIREILTILEKSMDDSILKPYSIDAKALGVSENRLMAIVVMLIDEGYITGEQPIRNTATRTFITESERLRITLKGLEYLRDNP